ncbi:MAG TPA: hypothetical protein VKA73_11020 [Rubrobacter sp.]|nr:hypothetical protein [Rubrobacter sp.]
MTGRRGVHRQDGGRLAACAVEQHLEGWSQADGPIGTKPAEIGGGHRVVGRKPARLSSAWPKPISIDGTASRKAASSASEASRGVERKASSVPGRGRREGT